MQIFCSFRYARFAYCHEHAESSGRLMSRNSSQSCLFCRDIFRFALSMQLLQPLRSLYVVAGSLKNVIAMHFFCKNNPAWTYSFQTRFSVALTAVKMGRDSCCRCLTASISASLTYCKTIVWWCRFRLALRDSEDTLLSCANEMVKYCATLIVYLISALTWWKAARGAVIATPQPMIVSSALNRSLISNCVLKYNA